MRVLLWYCAIASASAQLLSLPPVLQSIGAALQSLADPSPTPAPAPTPTPKTQPTPAPPPKPTPGPPVETSSSVISTSASTSTPHTKTLTSSTTTSTSSTSSTSTTQTTSTILNNAEPAATTTATGSSNSPGGLSQSAKTAIGVSIGAFVLCGLLAAALYSFVKDRHSSEAYAAWRERRNKKHTRLGSSSSNFFPSTLFGRSEKEMELSQVEHGNGTVLGRSTVAPITIPAASHTSQSLEKDLPASQSSQSLDKNLPAPPLTYQQAKPIQIKRKAVPGKKPRFSWMD